MASNSDTIGAVLQNSHDHVGQSIPYSRRGPVVTTGKSAAEIAKSNQDKSQWEWVEIPDTDLFGEPHTGVSVNFEKFLPGRYHVSPEMAFEIKRLIANRQRGDIRVLQPRQDVVMAQIMSRSQLGAPVNSNLDGLNDK